MLIVLRAATYASVFMGLLLVFVPRRILATVGVGSPEGPLALRAGGTLVAAAGGLLALWCVFTFAFVGKGTPAPFDPPRRLVVRGPYAVVRNPMYWGAGLVLGGAALVFLSAALVGYALLFMAVAHVFVRAYEEPTLRRTFGDDYAAYCRRVGRWLPRRKGNDALPDS
jgi:protein-S-isoprenylcysteine O-methyltransferase Ste14